MIVDPRTLTLRTKIIGSLIRDARQFREKTMEECAGAIGVSDETFEAYELGKTAPSLPELEGLAYFLDVPLETFLDNKPTSKEKGTKNIPNMDRLILLRQRMIGAILRQVRLEARIELEDLARYMQVEISLLEDYELGQQAIPLPHLEILSGALDRSVREFQDQHGPVGKWETKQRAIQDFIEMPIDLQVFASKPINRPYLELAIRLSEMSVDRLRSVAEGLLEITY